MRQRSTLNIAWIGPNLPVRIGQPKTKRFRTDSSLDAYLSATCPHSKRDPHGVCYECGRKEATHGA